MNTFKSIIVVAALAASALPTMAQRQRTSPHETISANFGGSRVTIVYGRPYTKDPKSGEPRKIWGELVKWDEPYRLGADEATLLLAQNPLKIGETTIPAGAYTLYLVPSEKGTSKLAFSTSLGKWGIPVDEKHDLARVDLKKDTLDKAVDQLTIAIGKEAPGGVIKITWENTQFSVPFTVQK